MSALLMQVVKGVLSVLLAPVITWLVNHAIITQDQTGQLIAEIFTYCAVLGVSIYGWIRSHQKQIMALTMPEGSTLAALKDKMETHVVDSTTEKNDPAVALVKSIGVVLLAVALTLGAACGGTPKVPNLPTLVTATDKDVRAATALAYMTIQAAAGVIDNADQLETATFNMGGVPASLHAQIRKYEDDALIGMKKVNAQIKDGTLKTWAQIQAAINPHIDKLNALLGLIKTPGVSFKAIFQAAATLLIQVFLPAIGGGGPLAVTVDGRTCTMTSDGLVDHTGRPCLVAGAQR